MSMTDNHNVVILSFVVEKSENKLIILKSTIFKPFSFSQGTISMNFPNVMVIC